MLNDNNGSVAIDYEYKFVVKFEEDNNRLDKYLQNQPLLQEFSRTQIQKAIKDEQIFINHLIATKTGQKLSVHDVITIKKIITNHFDIKKIVPENIPLDIVYEDESLLAINKPTGMVVHPAPGHYQGTLVNALIYRFQDLKVSEENLRPGIVHRIDKDTSGLLIVAKNLKVQQLLSALIKEHKIERHYLALVNGIVKHDRGKIELPIARSPFNRKQMAVLEEGKAAITHFTVKERFLTNTLIECVLETGRTHQIRVHMKYFKHPITGDLQ